MVGGEGGGGLHPSGDGFTVSMDGSVSAQLLDDELNHKIAAKHNKGCQGAEGAEGAEDHLDHRHREGDLSWKHLETRRRPGRPTCSRSHLSNEWLFISFVNFRMINFRLNDLTGTCN